MRSLRILQPLGCALVRVLVPLLVRALVLAPLAVSAGPLDCSIGSVSAVSVVYDPTAAGALSASGSLTVNCSKTGGNLDTRYLEIGAGAGLNASGGPNRAASGASLLEYALLRDASLTAAWGDSTGTRLSATVTSVNPASVTLNWWIRFPARQLDPAGTYVDTVTLRLYQGTAPNPSLTDTAPRTASLSVSALIETRCTLSSSPGTLTLAYSSFQATAASASTGFAVLCTLGAPYTASLDAPGGTLLDLNYQLSVSPAGPQTGSGVAQSMSIVGNVAAGQGGSCATASCSASRTHTLTITY